MTGNREHSGEALRNEQGFSLLEVMTVVAILGILATFAFPSVRLMLDRQDAKAGATQVAGMLNDARARALSEGTPHLVYFNAPEAGADGGCAAMAVEVRDADHSYSITPGDQTSEFRLSAQACQKVKPYGEDAASTAEIAAVPLPADDLAARAPDAAAAEAAVAAPSDDSSTPASSSKGKGKTLGLAKQAARAATVAETVVNGATFPVDPSDGRPVIAFSEQGVAVDPASPTEWGRGAGGVYLTDGESTVVAALVTPLGEVQLHVFDAASDSWK